MVGLVAAIEGAGRVEDGGAVVLRVGDAIAVGVIRGGGAILAGAEGDAGGLTFGHAAEEEVVVAGVGGGDGGEAFADLALQADRLFDAADGAGDGLAGSRVGCDCEQCLAVAVDGGATAHDEADLVEAGGDDGGVGVFDAVAAKDGDVGAEADGEVAEVVVNLEGASGVDGDHAPEVVVGEEAAEVVLVELAGAGELAADVHGARSGPVGAKRDADAELLVHRDLGGVAVERDVGAGRPDGRGAAEGHVLHVDGGEADGVDKGAVLRGQIDRTGGCAAEADILVAGLGIDALRDVGEVAATLQDAHAVGGGVVADQAEFAAGVAEREGLVLHFAGGEAAVRRGTVEVADEALRGAAAGHGGGAGEDLAELTPGHLVARCAAGHGEVAVAAEAAAPVVAVFEALVAPDGGAVLGEGEVVVGVDEAGRDHRAAAIDDGSIGRLAAAADAGDDAVGADEHRAAAVGDLAGQDGASDEGGGAGAGGNGAGVGGHIGERAAVFKGGACHGRCGVGARVGRVGRVAAAGGVGGGVVARVGRAGVGRGIVVGVAGARAGVGSRVGRGVAAAAVALGCDIVAAGRERREKEERGESGSAAGRRHHGEAPTGDTDIGVRRLKRER